MIFRPIRLHPVLIIQSNICLHAIVEFYCRMKMHVWPAPKIFPIIGTLLLNCTLKRYKYRCTFKKNLIFVFMSWLFCLFFIKKVLTCEIKWNTFYSKQCTHVFNRNYHHGITNISQCNSINWNWKILNKIHCKNQEISLELGVFLFFFICWASYCSYFVLAFLISV